MRRYREEIRIRKRGFFSVVRPRNVCCTLYIALYVRLLVFRNLLLCIQHETRPIHYNVCGHESFSVFCLIVFAYRYFILYILLFR